MYANLRVTVARSDAGSDTYFASTVDVDANGRVTFVLDESDGNPTPLKPGSTFTVPDGASVNVQADY